MATMEIPRIADRNLSDLSEFGFARLGTLLSRDECGALRAQYSDPKLFRSRVEMSRFGFGRGEYKYFAAPLPRTVAALRAQLYPELVSVANEWAQLLGDDVKYPPTLADFLSLCAEHGQTKPTPLLLRYQAGDYNCMHQDLYGAVVFPFQVV